MECPLPRQHGQGRIHLTKKANNTVETPDSLSYEQRIVAFLDILGFRSFVSEGYEEATRKIRAIDDALKHTLACIREQDEKGWVSIRSFSDCFCLSTEHAYLPTLLDAVAFLQFYLATSGIFVRGGISQGYHCETSRMIFSQGLVRAYELQRPDSYPRVLVAPDLLPRILSLSYSTDWGACGSLAEYILVDGAAVCFLDYLQAVVVAGTLGGDTEEFFEEHAQVLRQQLATPAADDAVRRKHLWLANYHNFRVREILAESDWEPDYTRELMQRLLVVLPESGSVHVDGKQVSFMRSRPETA